MLISVIMGVYNGEECVSKAIKSILNQTFKDFEFLIIDDGSNDSSYEIIKNYAIKDNRIKIIRNKDKIGLTKSLNKAIRQAKGDFIARQDDDDISLPKRFEIQLKFLQENPMYGFCGCNGIIKQNRVELLQFFELEEIKKKLIIANCFAHPSILMRKILLEKYGYYDENYLFGQDYELWCRLIYKYNIKSKNLKNKLIIMNIAEERLWKKKKMKFMIQRKNLIKTKLKYIKYSQNKVKGLISILIKLSELLFTLIFNRRN